mgnify:CR=1 FL=1
MKLKKLTYRGLMLLMALMTTNIAFADNFVPKITTDKKVADYFHKLLPTTTISSIYTTPYPNTYALIMGSNIVYGNLNSNYLTAGHMFNVNTQADITDYLQKLITPKINISQINVSDALIAKAPTGVNKKLIVFIDPDCPYCRALEAQIDKNGINKKADIYYMLMPLSMHPNAKAHTTNILCSTKPLQTLNEYMVNNNDNPKVTLTQGCNIEPVLERTAAVARNLSINGTPAIVTGDGTMIMGSDIEAISEYVNKK